MIGDYLYDLATDKKKGMRHWPAQAFIFLLSMLYGVIIRLFSFWQGLKPVQLGCKVISIGNLTVGGTGKTPLVMLVAGFLSGRGQRIAILTRGYKGGKTSGDEPLLISRKLPQVRLLVDKDRARSGAKAVSEFGVAAAVLDDGFQQWRLRKDLDIVAIDAQEGFGNRRVLPAGLCREPLSALRRADIFVITNTHLQPDTSAIRTALARYNPRALVAEAEVKPVGLGELSGKVYPLTELQGKRVALFCGIAKPQSFEQLVRRVGFTLVYARSFGDHYYFSRSDMTVMCAQAVAAGADVFLTTEKDAVRIDQSMLIGCSLPLYTLMIEMRITANEQSFYDRLSALLPA